VIDAVTTKPNLQVNTLPYYCASGWYKILGIVYTVIHTYMLGIARIDGNAGSGKKAAIRYDGGYLRAPKS